MAKEVRQADYDTWVRFSRAFDFEDSRNEFQVGVMNAYTAEWLQNRVGTRSVEILTEQLGRPVTVQFTVHYFRENC